MIMKQDELLCLYEKCRLCPRDCKAERSAGKTGYCGMDSKLRIGGTMLHMWEEPCISGEKGSGAIFFSGCSLRCIYCQNKEISLKNRGKEIDTDSLIDIFYKLEEEGANNIDFITAEHFIPGIAIAIDKAKTAGFKLPFVLNTGSYIKTETLKHLEGLIDIYLPDMKYISGKTATVYSNAQDYPDVAKAAIAEMVRQVNAGCRINENGIMQSGIIVRHMLLPGRVIESKLTVKYLYETYGDDIYISLMNQYTPMPGISERYPELGRRVTDPQYRSLVDYAASLGVTNAFVQVGKTSDKSFIPDFEYAKNYQN